MIGEKGEFCAFSMSGYSGRRVWPPSASAVAGKGGGVKVVVIRPTVFLGFGGPPPENRPPPHVFLLGVRPPTARHSCSSAGEGGVGSLPPSLSSARSGGAVGSWQPLESQWCSVGRNLTKRRRQPLIFTEKEPQNVGRVFFPLCMPRCLRGTLL